MISGAGFKSYWAQHDVYFVNYHPIRHTNHDKIGDDLGQVR